MGARVYGGEQMHKVLVQIIFIVFVFFSASTVYATTYYVAQNDYNASDSNPGTEALPWLTLKHATNNSSIGAGDTVIVKAGTYVDTTAGSSSMAAFSPKNSGSAGSPITFRSEPRFAAIIDNPSNSAPSWGVVSRSYIVIDGFKVIGGAGFKGGSNNTIKNCEVTVGSLIWNDSSLHWGIWLQESSYSIVQNNYVHSMSTSLGSSNNHNSACIMVFKTNGAIIENNTVDGNNKYRKGFGTKATPVTNCTWRYNFAIDCSEAFQIIGGTSPVSGWVFHNNIIVDSGKAFMVERKGDGHKIYNNTAYDVDRFIYHIALSGEATTDMELWNNIAASNTNVLRFEGYGTSDSWNALISYSDYNSFSGTYGTFADGVSGPSDYAALSSWRSGTGFASSSTDSTSHGFFNAGGTTPEDYKRTSYPANGRGGTYASVQGAYVTGNEVIGHTTGSLVAEDSPPASLAAPVNFKVEN